MFLVDDLLKTVLGYAKDLVLQGKTGRDEAIKSSRVAMRELAKSLAEVTALIERGIHQLKRTQNEPEKFKAVLSTIVDEHSLLEACNESGVCKDLRLAQDALQGLSAAFTDTRSGRVQELSYQLDTYELGFVQAVREFLAQARDYDLVAASGHGTLDTGLVIRTLEERVRAMKRITGEIEEVLELFRDRDLRARLPDNVLPM